MNMVYSPRLAPVEVVLSFAEDADAAADMTAAL